VVDEHIVDGVAHRPPRRDKIPWLLPRADDVLGLSDIEQSLSIQERDAALYEDLRKYHKGISELPDDSYYDLITAWDMHTYLPENSHYSPIICLYAVPERGKSRTGKGMINVAYRGIHVESLREAYLLRVANDLGASLFFDVRDIWRKAERSNSEDILLLRFERGAKVARVLYPDRGAHEDMRYYNIFGPTVIGTNEGVHHILETRAIQINMPESTRSFENEVTPGSALSLKERLVLFRARHLGQTLPDVAKPAKGRLGDIMKPLLQMILLASPEREQGFRQLVRDLDRDRHLEKSDSVEAQIVAAVAALADDVENGILAVKRITEEVNTGRPERYRFTPQRVGRKLWALGFKKAKTKTGASALIWDQNLVGKLVTSYDLPQTSVTSVIPESRAEDTDVTDITDVSHTTSEEIPF